MTLSRHWRPAELTAQDHLSVQFDGEDLHGSWRRHAGLGAARQRRASGRALVQVSPAARHLSAGPKSPMRWWRSIAAARREDAEPARHAGRAVRWARRGKPEPLAIAGLRRWCRQRSALAAVPGRLLLQDVHGSALPRLQLGLEDDLRADHPSRSRASARRRPGPTPTATQAVRSLRRIDRGAGRRGLRRPLCGRQRCTCHHRDEQAEIGGSLLADTAGQHRRQAVASGWHDDHRQP